MGNSLQSGIHRGRIWSGALLVVCLVHAGIVRAADPATDRIAVLEKKLDESMQMIRDLRSRVNELESQLNQNRTSAVAAQPTAAQSPAATEQRLADVENTVREMATNVGKQETGLPLHGFADVGAGNHNAEFSHYKGADVGSLEFFLTPRFTSRTQALFELSIEAGSDGSIGLDLERAQIGYQFGDSLSAWLGRFHTPYGFYNTAFHHGQQIATSLRRPRFIEFEDHGGIMPAHTVGLWLTGAARVDGGKLTYDAFIGNAQRISGGILDMNNAGTASGNATFGGNLGFLPGGELDGLKIGIDGFTTRIDNQDVLPVSLTRVNSYGVYAAYDTDRWENIAEFHTFQNQDLTGNAGSHRSHAGFAQFAYRAGRYIPYARYERAALQQSDPFFAAQTNGNSYYREALGVRFDVDIESALKMELAETHYTDRAVGSFDEALMQYAIRF